MQLRNVGNETYQDFITGKSAEPDEVIEVPDEYEDFYFMHPLWREVGAPAPAPAPVPEPEPAVNVQPEPATGEGEAQTPVVESDPVPENQEQN